MKILIEHLPPESFTWLSQAAALKRAEEAAKVARIRERTAHYAAQAARASAGSD